MFELIEVERGVEFAVYDREDVLVERRGHARLVIVSAQYPRRILDEIRAEQERVVRLHLRRESREEMDPRARHEVTDGAAEKGDHSGATIGDHLEMAIEVTDDTAHREPGILRGDHLGCVDQRALADVEGHVAFERSVCSHRVEEYACLVGTAGPELNQCVGVREVGDGAGVANQDRSFGFGGVVLGKPSDLLEQSTALSVIEPFGWKILRCRRQAGEHVSRQCAPYVIGAQIHIDRGVCG